MNWFNPLQSLDRLVFDCAQRLDAFDGTFCPQLRIADPRFGDYQANGVLAFAKANKQNPRALAESLVTALGEEAAFPSEQIQVSIAGPGFINFKLDAEFLWQWILHFRQRTDFEQAAASIQNGAKVVIDYPSANTAKQAHIGHLRPMVIGQAIARLLAFSGADLIRDNHIGDWGTNFGTLIMQIKRDGIALNQLGENGLAQLDALYKKGSQSEIDFPELREQSRQELVRLQNGDPENTALWQTIVAISNTAFAKLFDQLGVEVDYNLGESFYRDKVDRVYQELLDLDLAETSDEALVVWHDEVKKFARDSERPYPFTIRKRDGASNYASTDLATALYRTEHFKADQIIYLTDARQQDHFEQLFLTVDKWFQRAQYPVPKLQHVWWGTILGADKKPFKTKSGETIKLQALLDEAVQRAYAVVNEKNPDLDEAYRQSIARSVGIGALKYADLSSNRTQDYVFDWDRLLSFEGNTAPYLMYAVVRINSIFRKLQYDPKQALTSATTIETEEELLLARKLIQFSDTLERSLKDLRPHILCTYLYELAVAYSSFYNTNPIAKAEPSIQARRLALCARTRTILTLGLDLLGIDAPEQM
jgi:arginyl-tRNA synthetase